VTRAFVITHKPFSRAEQVLISRLGDVCLLNHLELQPSPTSAHLMTPILTIQIPVAVSRSLFLDETSVGLHYSPYICVLMHLTFAGISVLLSDVGAAYGRPKPISWQLTDERRAASVPRSRDRPRVYGWLASPGLLLPRIVLYQCTWRAGVYYS
jgi:hypothetical protein